MAKKFEATLVMIDGKQLKLGHYTNTGQIKAPGWARDGGFWWSDPEKFVPGESNLVWIPYHAILRIETSGKPERDNSSDE